MRLAEKVASRYRLAKEFPSEKALRQYLKDHPDADKAKHKVNESQEGGPADKPGTKQRPKAPPPAGGKTPSKAPPPPAGGKTPSKAPPPPAGRPKGTPPPLPDKAKKKPEAPEAKPQAPADKPQEPAKPQGKFDAWKAKFKGLTEPATAFMEKAPKAVKHFFGDSEFRKHALTEAKDAIANAPKKMIHNLVETAKEEVHEFKTAGQGVKAVVSGGKMSKKQKAAFKEVATHMAIAGAATAFAASGPLAAAGIFTKGLIQHVALKSVSKSLGSLHTLQELRHISHGVTDFISHIAAEGKDSAAEEAMAKLVMAAVAKEIEALSDEDFTEVLNSMESDSNKTARIVAERFIATA